MAVKFMEKEEKLFEYIYEVSSCIETQGVTYNEFKE
jgi:hypothetical protein